MLSMIEKLINEHGSSTILKERLSLINDKYELLDNQLKNCEKENELLRKEVEMLKSKLSEQVKEEPFIAFKDAKFKRNPSGSFEETAYCPKCNGAMFALDSFFPYTCGACGSTAGFNGSDLKKVIKEVQIEYT